MPYPHLPPARHAEHDAGRRCRAGIFDPKIGADLYNRYLDEYMIADELGLNLMVNEHHQTATCIDVAAPLSAAILARQTRKGRICILGNPVANRGDPIRIAEEMAMIDCISRGRLDVGFVRGVPYEIFAANTNPTQTVERLWEGIDLVVKAWTSARRAVQLRRPLHASAQRQPLAAALPGAASAGLDHRLERLRRHHEGWPAAATCSRRSCSRTTRCGPCSTPIAAPIVDQRPAGRRRHRVHAAGLSPATRRTTPRPARASSSGT